MRAVVTALLMRAIRLQRRPLCMQAVVTAIEMQTKCESQVHVDLQPLFFAKDNMSRMHPTSNRENVSCGM
jgi:hypothetical protein